MRWIVGDIHGMEGPLRKLIGAVRGIDSAARFYFVGDYVNRGPDSKGVIDLLLTLENAKFCRGNHDDIFGQVLSGDSYALNAANGDQTIAFRWFMQHGLAETFMSYGVDYSELEYLETNPNEERLEEMLRCVPDSHRRFVASLGPVIEEEDLFVAHGKWSVDRESEGLDEQLATSARLRQELLWGRFETAEITWRKPWERIGYFGHTPVEYYESLLTDPDELVPVAGPKVVLLDTAAALRVTGRLTAVCHETGRYVQVNRFGVTLPGGVIEGHRP